jgi:hypothetical protein
MTPVEASATTFAPLTARRPEKSERHQRTADVGLDEHECAQQHRGCAQHHERRGRGKAILLAARDAVDHHRQSAGDGDRPRDVERSLARAVAALADQARREHQRRDADGNVDVEDPAPAQRVGERTADDQPGGGTGGRYRPEDAKRAIARGSLGEGGGDQRQRGRGGERPAQALQRAPGEQDALALGRPAHEGRHGEHRDAGDEEPAAAEQVAGPPGEDEEAAEGQRVERHHVLQGADREAEVRLDARQRDVGDRVVEHQHELHRAQQREHGSRARGGRRRAHACTASPVPRAARSAPAHQASSVSSRSASWACQSSLSRPSRSKAM